MPCYATLHVARKVQGVSRKRIISPKRCLYLMRRCASWSPPLAMQCLLSPSVEISRLLPFINMYMHWWPWIPLCVGYHRLSLLPFPACLRMKRMTESEWTHHPEPWVRYIRNVIPSLSNDSVTSQKSVILLIARLRNARTINRQPWQLWLMVSTCRIIDGVFLFAKNVSSGKGQSERVLWS